MHVRKLPSVLYLDVGDLLLRAVASVYVSGAGVRPERRLNKVTGVLCSLKRSVLLGSFAKGVPGNEFAGEHAGALVNGNTYSAKEEAQAIDTRDVPRFPVHPLDAAVLWTPDPALLLLSSSSETPRLPENTDNPTTTTTRKDPKYNILARDVAIIREVKARGGTKVEAAKACGRSSSGGDWGQAMKLVWDDAE
jgi:hypothetical protein